MAGIELNKHFIRTPPAGSFDEIDWEALTGLQQRVHGSKQIDITNIQLGPVSVCALASVEEVLAALPKSFPSAKGIIPVTVCDEKGHTVARTDIRSAMVDGPTTP